MSRPSGVITTDLQIKKEDRDELRARWEEQAKGLNAGGTPILTHGMKFQPISISNEDAQIVDQLKLNDRTIASVFGVPAILLGITDTATQKSAEALMTEWLASGLGFVITHIEQAFDKFIGLDRVPAGKEWTELDTRVLLRSMFKERIEGLARGVQGGIYLAERGARARGLSGGQRPATSRACSNRSCRCRLQRHLLHLRRRPVSPISPVPAEDPDEDDEEATDRALVRRAAIAMRDCAMQPNLGQGSRRDACRSRAMQRQIPAVVAEAFGKTMVPPELAEQVKAAIHLLHESPPIVQLNAPPRSASPLPPPRPSRIERTENGGFKLIYDEPQP